MPETDVVDEPRRRLDHIQELTADLARVRHDAIEQQAMAERIVSRVVAAKDALKTAT